MTTNQQLVGMNAIDLFNHASVELAPLRGLAGGGLTMQAWVRPRPVGDRRGLIDLGGGPNGERVALYYGGGQRRLFVEVTLAGETYTLANIRDVIVPDQWVHVTAALGADGRCAIFLGGKQVIEGRDAALPIDALKQLLSASVLSRCALGRGEQLKAPAAGAPKTISGSFPGALAEVRVWNRRLTDAEIEGHWQLRARGDEPGLIACYRLDALVGGGGVIDLSAGRGHGRASAGAAAIHDAALPLASTSGTADAQLLVRGKLVREYLPLSAFPDDRALVPAAEQAKDRRSANADAFGAISGDDVLCSVYESTLEPRRADGLSTAGDTIQIRVDGPVLAIVDDSEESSLVAWAPGHEYALEVPLSGKLRVRVLAGEALDCPTMRLRWSELPAGVWQAARPAELAHRKLQALRADDLLSPPEGTRSPLPAGTSREDAEALAAMLAAVATALPIADAGDDETAMSFADADDDDRPTGFGLDRWIEQITQADEAAQIEDDDDGEDDEGGEPLDDTMPVSFGLGKLFKKAKKGVSKAAKATAKAAEDAAKASAAAAKKAAEEAAAVARAAEEAAKKAAEKAAKEAAAAKRAAEEAAKKAAEKAAKEAAAAKRAAEEAAKKAAKEAAEKAKAVEEAAKKAAEKAAKEAAEQARALEEAAAAAKRAAEKAAEEAAAAAKWAAEKAAAAAEEAARITMRLAAQGSREASKFIVKSGKELIELAEKAARVAPQFGKAAARACIREASQVAIATLKDGQAWRVIQLVGTTIVDGVEKAWRVVVSGVEDALATVIAFFERIGATIRTVVDYLAKLFDWSRFLAASDKIYAAGLVAFERFGDFLEHGAPKLFDEVEELLRSPLDSKLADKSFGEALGIDPNKGVPVLDELEHVVDQIQRLFSSKKRKVDAPLEHTPDDPGATASDAAGASDELGRLIPSDSFTSPRSILDLPMRPLLALPVQAWRLGEPVIRPTFKLIGDSGALITRGGLKLLKARIEVPWLTKMIETTVLGGRRLDLLRIISLLGAIPAVLIEAGGALIEDAIASFGEGADNSHVSTQWVRWLTFGSSLLNSIVVVARAILEKKATATHDRVGIPLLLFVNGMMSAIQGGASFALTAELKGSAVTYSAIGSALGCITAGWYFVYGDNLGKAILAQNKPAEELWVNIDIGVQVSLGLVTVITGVVAYAEKESNDETLGVTLGFRATSWIVAGFQKICDGLDNRLPKVALASIALAAVNVSVDVAEGLYYAVKAAED